MSSALQLHFRLDGIARRGSPSRRLRSALFLEEQQLELLILRPSQRNPARLALGDRRTTVSTPLSRIRRQIRRHDGFAPRCHPCMRHGRELYILYLVTHSTAPKVARSLGLQLLAGVESRTQQSAACRRVVEKVSLASCFGMWRSILPNRLRLWNGSRQGRGVTHARSSSAGRDSGGFRSGAEGPRAESGERRERRRRRRRRRRHLALLRTSESVSRRTSRAPGARTSQRSEAYSTVLSRNGKRSEAQ